VINLIAVLALALSPLLGIISAVVHLRIVRRADNARRRVKRSDDDTPEAKPTKRKMEFVKIILLLVLSTYFAGVIVGARIVFLDFSQLDVWLIFIGTPATAAIGFYCWKAKAENIIKIKKENPVETEGIPVDVNNIAP